MIEKTGAVLNPGRVGSWRGVIDQVEYKSSALGPYVSGTRLWRCLHSHRSENTAIRCAEREAANPRPAAGTRRERSGSGRRRVMWIVSIWMQVKA